MTYTIYHIPGKKIGVTQNLDGRVHMQQGYLPGEYEILDEPDIDRKHKKRGASWLIGILSLMAILILLVGFWGNE